MVERFNKNINGEVIDYLTSPHHKEELKKALENSLKELVFFKNQSELTVKLVIEAVVEILKEKNFVVAKKIF